MDILDHPIFEKEILTREDVEELLAGPRESKRALFLWIHREKCARAVAKLCLELGVDLPEKNEQEKLCALLFRMTSPATPVWGIIEDLDLARRCVEDFALGAPASAFVSLDDIKGRA